MRALLFILCMVPALAWADSCNISSAAPSYGSGSQSMSCDQKGGLRTQVTDGAGNTIGTVANPQYIQGSVSSSPATPSTAGPTSITASQCSSLTSLAAQGGIGVLVTGTWTGTLTASKSVDGTTFTTARMTAQPVGTTGSGSSITANGTFTIDSAGMATVKVCGNTVSSGTAVVSLRTNTAAETTIDGVALLGGTAGVPAAVAITTQPPTESTAATTTTVLAGADATVCAADTTSAERLLSNNGSATAYVTLGATAASGVGIPVTVGATYIEDRYRGAIHAYGTGNFNCQKVSP